MLLIVETASNFSCDFTGLAFSQSTSMAQKKEKAPVRHAHVGLSDFFEYSQVNAFIHITAI